MTKRLIAAVLIAIFALGSTGASLVLGPTEANAEPRGEWRGRSRGRSYRGRRGHDYRPENPLPGILGGIIGGWLSQQLTPKEEPEEEEFDGPPSNSR
jgi:hypothetical protein